MGRFQAVCMGLLAAIGQTQELQNCSVETNLSTVGSTEDAVILATSLECSNGDFVVEWIGEVFVAQTLRVSNGTSLNITGAGPGATVDGQQGVQLFVVDGGTLHLSGITLAHGYASSEGGAIYAESSTVLINGNTSVISNSAGDYGGAIYSSSSNVTWDGDAIEFRGNYAGVDGGAICSHNSNLSWDGDGIEFSNNYAGDRGGSIYSFYSNVSWVGDVAQFSNNHAGVDGGAICSTNSNVAWDGDGAKFSNNSAGDDGGAIYARRSSVDMVGDGIEFSNNYAGDRGGAIYSGESTVTWDGDGTKFCTNHADGGFGGAIFARAPSGLSWNGPTNFSSNVAGAAGGAVALTDFGYERTDFTDATFIDNRSHSGGAFYVYNSAKGLNFTNVRFVSNSASGAGGAFAMYAATDHQPATFSGCEFVGNTADGTGGAVETLSGQQEITSCIFEGNSADIGGAMRLGGEAVIHECSFVSNSAHTRGLAIAVVGSASISGSSFSGNDLHCSAGSYREDIEDESTKRFQAVCDDCPAWDECSDCSMARSHVTPTCVSPLEHTSAEETGVVLETLDLAGGYWRATNKSYNILACFNADACSGGQTGAENYCNSGYKGPYCAVCETDFSPSRDHTCTRCSSSKRQGLMAATAIAALVAVFAAVMSLKFLLSMEVDERDSGWFHRRILRALPVQAVKIIVVVWQILTQFADAANVTYPDVYQDFLSVIDIVNFDLASALAAGCLWSDMDFHDRLLVSTLGPLAVVGVLAITYRIAMHRSGAAGRTAVTDSIRHRHQTALLLLTFLVYSSVSSTVFQTFACETLDDGIEYLRADYSIYCSDAKHQAIEIYAGIMVLVYPVGIPLLYTVMLYQHRFLLSDAGADKTAAQPISSLWEPYRPERFYYEVIECARRIMLTGVVVFIFPNDTAQIAITMLIAFFFFVVFEVLSPYESESDVWLSRGGHVIVFLSIFDMLLLKVDVSDESDRSQAIFGGALVGGHALIVLAIVVEVAGVCYAFRNKQVVDGESSPHNLPDLGLHAGSDDDVPVFESIPATWRSFMRHVSVTEEPGRTQSASGTVFPVDRASGC